ncbi:MAG: cytochrome bc complex cytochrome b subunit [Planctomycetota bacterium]
MSSVSGWFKERLPFDGSKLQHLTSEPVPYHMKRWWFCLGGTPAYLFMVQVVTGILLAFYYEASTARAYESVRYITEDAAFGWYLRSVHKWGATLMIATMILHQMRVFFTGAYRKPREINWLVGMLILVTTLVIGFTGYSLVFEQLSYWGVTVGGNISKSVPVVGPLMHDFLFGGAQYGAPTVPRLYVLHAAVLPVVLVLLLVVHFTVLRIQGVTDFRFSDEDEGKTFRFFPDHVYTEIIAGLVLMILLSALATIFPAFMGPKADPLTTPEVIKPEWWFMVTFRWLKLMGITAAVLSMGLIVFLMFVWPFVDAWIVRRTRNKEVSTVVGVIAVIAITGLTVWEALVAH